MNKPTPKSPFNVTLLLFIALAVTPVVVIAVFLITRQPQETPDAFTTAETSTYQGSVYDPPLELDDFTLPASTGQDLSLSDLRGKWVLLFFGFAHCPDICPTTLVEHAQALQLLGDDAAQVQVVFVSVDGERDTPPLLATYMARFNPTFIGLQGNPETLARIQPQFGLWYEIAPHDTTAESYNVDHSARTYLINPDGRLQISYSFGTGSRVLADSILQAMQQN